MEGVSVLERRGTLGASIYEQLKFDITHWVYRPGQRLIEEAIAERFGVSRTPIREALRRLEQEQLVVYVPQHGYSTAGLNLKELNGLYQVRIAVEELSVTLAVQARMEEGARRILQELYEMWEEEVEIPSGGNPDFVYADEAFHEGLAFAGGNGYLHGTLKSLNERIRIIRITDFGSAERIEATYSQHAGILKAISEGEDLEARRRMRDHILESQAHVSASAAQALLNVHG